MKLSYSDIAARLGGAYSAGAVPSLRDVLGPTDGADAYAVQAINTEYWVGQGRRIVGRKVGLTAKAVQQQLGVDQPDFGILFDDIEIRNVGMLLASRILQPKAEVEVVFILGADLNSIEVTREDVASAVA